jgi:serine protease Do
MRQQTITKTLLSLAAVAIAASLSIPAHAQATARAHDAQVFMRSESPYLGIGGQDITSDRAKALKLKEEHGAEVTTVYPDTAASKAGLQTGDVVLEYNGQRVEGWQQLQRLVSETPVGREVKIVVWRNGSSQTLTAAIGPRKEATLEVGPRVFTMPNMRVEPMEPPAFPMPEFRTFTSNRALGIFGEPLRTESQLAEFFGVKDGILVRSVTKSSAAEKAGIKAGDVITKIDDATVSSPADISSKLRAGASKRTFNLTVVRNHKEMPISVTIEPSTVTRGQLDWPQMTPQAWRQLTPQIWQQLQDDGKWLQLFPDDGVVQITKKPVTKIVWQ